ncbi:MAG: carboxypeptidase regulatory-like domain-containing protein [Gemmatimonadaceae bacterium]
MIIGVVVDTALNPIAGAGVTVVRTGEKLMTNDRGRFVFTGAAGSEYYFFVRQLRFEARMERVTVTPGDTVRPAFIMVPLSATVLEAVEIRARRQSQRLGGFERRRRAGWGRYITQEEIDARGAIATVDLVRRMGIPLSTLGSELIPISFRMGTPCAMQIVVDEFRMYPPVSMSMLPPPREIAAIEVYRGMGGVPAQYGANACGTVLIWTRDGY